MSEKSFDIKGFHAILKICETKDKYWKFLLSLSRRFEPSRNSLWKKQWLDNQSMIEYIYETVVKNKFFIKKVQKIQKTMTLCTVFCIMVVSLGLEPRTSCMWSMRSNQLSYETVSFSKIFFIYNIVSISLSLKLVNLFIEKIFPFSNFLFRKTLAFPKRKNLLWNHLKSLVLFAKIYYHYKW